METLEPDESQNRYEKEQIDISSLIDVEKLKQELISVIPDLKDNDDAIKSIITSYKNSKPLTDDKYSFLTAELDKDLKEVSFFYDEITDFKFLSCLPRINRDFSDDIAKMANYRFQFERNLNDPFAQNIDFASEIFSKGNIEKIEMIFALHLIRALLNIEHKDQKFLLELLKDRVKIIDDSLKRTEESGSLESLYYRLAQSFNDNEVTIDITQELIAGKSNQSSENSDNFIEELNPTRYLSPIPSNTDNTDLTTRLTQQKDSLRRRFLISERVNPNTEQKEEIWTKGINDIVKKREDTKVFTFSSPNIFTENEADLDQINLDELDRYEDYAERGNQLKFVRNFIKRITAECELDEIHIKLDRVISDKVVSFFKEKNPTNNNEEDTLNKDLYNYRDNTLVKQLNAFFESEYKTFQAYLRSTDEIETETVPRYIAHFLEMLELIKEQNIKVKFLDDKLISSDKKILILGKGPLSKKNLKKLKVSKEKTLTIIHSVHREEDDSVIYNADLKQLFLASAIRNAHKFFSQDKGTDLFGTVASSTLYDEETYNLFNSYLQADIPESVNTPNNQLIIDIIKANDRPPADYYFTTVSNEPPKEEEILEESVDKKNPAGVGV